MIIEDAWKILGIDPTKDENEIKTAYRTCVVKVNPEDDPEGFKQLREAYDMAMASLNEAGEDEDNNESAEENKDEIDIHIDKADEIYKDIYSRIDENVWREWLKAPVVNELDTADKLREKFLAYCMGHFEFPHNIWKLFDSVFNYKAERDSLVEMFPSDYLDFIIYQTENEGFMDYDRITDRASVKEKLSELGVDYEIESKPGIYEPEVFDVPIDLYIKEISFMHGHIDRVLKPRYSDYMTSDEKIESAEEREKMESEALDHIKCVLNYLDTFDIFNPIELAAKLRVLFFEDRFEEAVKLARLIIDNKILDSVDVYTYATAMFVLLETENIQGTLNEETLESCDQLADKLLEIIDTSIMSLEVKGQVRYFRKDYEKSSEYVIKALDINSRNSEAIMLLRRSSDDSVGYYLKAIEDNTASEKDKMELAWSYFRNEKTDETLAVLDTIKPDDEIFYGYNNLYGRCYYNKNQFEDSYPFLVKWVEMIEAMEAKKLAGEKLSDKDEERLTRMGFCYYMRASCAEKLDKMDEAVTYYKKSIERTKETYNDINELMYYMECFGELLHKNGDYPGAMEIWNDMIGRIEHCIPAYVHRQKTAFEMKDAQLVIDDYYNITRDVPQYPDAYELAARVFEIYNHGDDVEAVYKRAEEAGVVTDKLRVIRARMTSRNVGDKEALELYKEIETNIENNETNLKDPEDVVSLYADIANIYMNSKDGNGKHDKLNEAEEYIKKGRAVDENNKRLYWLMTDIKEWKNEGAETVYDKMLELFPDDANVDYEYAEYYRRARDVEKAMQYYESCLKKNSHHRSANNKLMNIYQTRYLHKENRDDYDKAVSYANAQLENDDDDYYYVERALLHLDGYEFDKTFEDASRAVEKNPNNVYAHNARGLALMRKSKFESALECFDKAIEVMEKGETSNPYINAAKCCEALMDYERAIHYLETCKREHDYNTNVINALARNNVKLRRYEIAVEYYNENEKYYTKKRKETNNLWYDLDILKMKYRRAEAALLSGNMAALERINVEDINVFLRENGYLAVETYLNPKGKERIRIAKLFKELADFYLFTKREFKKAVHFYEQCCKYWCPEDSQSKKGLLGMFGSNKNVPRPEETEDDMEELDLMAAMYMNFAFASFLNSDISRSEEFSKRSNECIIKGYGSEERYLTMGNQKPYRMRLVALNAYFQGDKEKTFRLLDGLTDCLRCNYCIHGICYEKELFLARVYEMEGERELAREYYTKAFANSMDDAEAYKAIKDLEK